MHKKSLSLITPVDILIIVLLIGIGGASTLLFARVTPREFAVYRSERLLARYPLDQNETYSLEGNKGPVRIAVQDGAVSVVHATCKNQICVRSRPIRSAGEQIICVPNEITVEIPASTGDTSCDAVTR